MHKALHWKTLNTATVVKDDWIHVVKHHVQLPNGMELKSYFGVDIPDWGAVFALTDNQKVVMIKQYRHGLDGVFYELPAGVIDDGEDPSEGCRRELLEEAGYGSENELQFLGKMNPSPAKFNNWNHVYLMEGATKIQNQQLDQTEDIIVELVPLNKVKDLIREGLVPDSFMVAAIYMALDELS